MRNRPVFASARCPRALSARLIVTLLLVVSAFPIAGADSPRGGRLEGIWKSVLDRMPDGWRRARRVDIRWVTDREMNELVNEQDDEDEQQDAAGTVQGFYDRALNQREPATITIRENLSRDEATFVLTHEYAHMVWDEALSRRQRSDYRRIWEEQRRKRRLVSRYAGDSPEEGFAEAVATYLLQKEKLKRRDAASFDFVEDLVRAAKEREGEAREAGSR